MAEQIEAEIETETKAYWMERALRAEGLVERMMTDPPAQMSTPLGLLPVNGEGMRRLSDELGQAKRTLAELAGLCQAQDDLLKLMRSLRATEAEAEYWRKKFETARQTLTEIATEAGQIGHDLERLERLL